MLDIYPQEYPKVRRPFVGEYDPSPASRASRQISIPESKCRGIALCLRTCRRPHVGALWIAAWLFFRGIRGRFSVCKNSKLDIGRGSKGKGVKFKLVNSRVRIGEGCELGALKISAMNCTIEIGDGTRFVGASEITSIDGCNISLGKGCLVANGCWITASDLHAICDAADGGRLNPSRPIAIEDRVWLARDVIVLKGSIIGKGSAIGIRSIVTKPVPAHCLAVGAPARPIKHNIHWE